MTNKDIIKTASDKYQKMTHIEHVLKRSDMYVGSINNEMKSVFVVDNVEDFKNSKIVYKNINYNSGFIKIFDEVLSNASDYSVRTNKVTYIKVNIENDHISIENDGPGIPVVMHEKEKIYIGEMVFGHLLTSDNYDDTEERYTSGRNGIGVKLCNIYSKKFILETSDGNKQYYQEFKNNLGTIGKPKIRKSKKNYVRITYYPDYEKFGLEGMTDDIKSVLIRRIFDISAYLPSVKVYLNGKIIPIKSFKDYMKLYTDESNIYYEKIDDCWEIGVIKSPVDSFTHVSLVNGISTIVGGNHVNLVSSYLVNSIRENIVRNNKNLNIKPFDIKNRMLLFVNTKIINPVFDTQTKENLISKINIKDFNISDNFLKKLSKDDMFSDLIELSLLKEQLELEKELNKGTSKRVRIDKLLDANKAGTTESEKCYLMLTEGDSAKSFAVTGFAETGRDYFGAFPLRGKPLNVRDTSISKIKENEEIKNIIQILGLEFGKKYINTKSLRYGKVIFMTDADSDGYHIKGLLINLFDAYWPELLKLDYIYEFVTPILRVSGGGKKKFFYKISDYTKWLSENNNGKGYTTKYYKGLGTTEPVDVRMFFKNIDKHLIKFNYSNSERTEDLIDLAFRKKREDDRKDWLLNYKPNQFVDKFSIKTTYESFMDTEFIEFSMADNIRSIPSLIDGLKPSQRKILYTLFKTGGNGELNVGEVFGLVKSTANYHHGPQSLEQGIINMAQDFIGSNNISLLEPIGQFGTRLSGGKDAAAPRYIYTRIKDITKNIFIPDDNNILDYKEEDGKLVEPMFYVPIIPNILLNGAEGIGTGWSTVVPKFKIEDLIEYIDNKLYKKRKNIELKPYYENFKGEIIYDEESKSYITKGIINRLNSTTLNITELPVGIWNENYYELLDKLVDDKVIRTYTKDCTDTNVDIKIRIPKEQLDILSDDELYKIFDLSSKIRISNMHLFDINGKIKKYENQYQIIDEYFDVRLNYYNQRKTYLINKLTSKKYYFDNVIKFITMVVNKKLIINNVPINEIIESLEKNKIQKIDDSYDYLLNIPIYKLSKEQLDKLHEDYKKLIEELKEVIEISIEKMWHNDLNDLRKMVKKIRK